MPDPRWPSYDESEVTITSNYASETIVEANFVPYQTASGDWRMTFNFAASHTNSLDGNWTISGVTFKNVSNFYQAVSLVLNDAEQALKAFTQPNTSVIDTRFGTNATDSRISGDVLLESKPTWATKNAPDVYLAGNVNADVVVAKAYLSGDQTVTSGSGEKIEIDTVIKDSHGDIVNTSDNRFDIPVSGDYVLSGTVLLDTNGFNGTTQEWRVSYKINGAGDGYYIARYAPNSSSDNRIGLAINEIISDLNAGDYIEVFVFQDSGTDATLFGSVIANTKLGIHKITSAQEVANAIVGFSEAQDGKAGLIEYDYDELDISSSGDFSASQPVLRLARVGSVCTLTWPNLAHSSDNFPESASGFIPEHCRPNDYDYSVYYITSTKVRRITVKPDGGIAMYYRDWSGSAVNDIGTTSGSVSWVVDE
jgi:hypothetical protein